MQIIPIRDLKNTVEIEKRCANSGEPVFVTKNGYGRLVVMDIALYEKTIKDIYEAKQVNEALDELKDGAHLFNGAEIRKKVSARYGG